MTQVKGISDFLNQAGTQFKVFDMGRRIEEMSQADFLSFEQGEISYPLPLGLDFWYGRKIKALSWLSGFYVFLWMPRANSHPVFVMTL